MKVNNIISNSFYPFSNGLRKFMYKSTGFFNSLKLSNRKRFEFIPLILTSSTPNTHNKSDDQVIGMWYVDKNNLNNDSQPIFKQDFIINLNSDDEKFVSYTSNCVIEDKNLSNDPSVKKIEKFFSIYGNEGKYYHKDNEKWEHHYSSIEDLPTNKNLVLQARKIKNYLECGI